MDSLPPSLARTTEVGIESVMPSIRALFASAVLSEAALLRVILAGGGDGRAPGPWLLDESTMVAPAFARNGAGLSRSDLSDEWGKRDEKGLNTSAIFFSWASLPVPGGGSRSPCG